MNESQALLAAIEVAKTAGCGKSRRGVVIFRRDEPEPIAVGSNGPPPGFRCDLSEACRAACGKICVHAEEEALLAAGPNAAGCEMLHVKIVEQGMPVYSDGPSCWQCSRAILHAGITRMWLLQEDGDETIRGVDSWQADQGEMRAQAYTAEDFHSLTLTACDLPEIR